ncbi:hypothetical protein M9458_029191, partial [Cirrhinus mrigala]
MAFNFSQTGTGGFTFGTPKTTAAATTGFGLQTSTPAGGGFSFGATQPQTQTFGNQPQHRIMEARRVDSALEPNLRAPPRVEVSLL